MQNTLILIGYTSGTSKETKKPYNIINFLTVPVVSKSQDSAYSKVITVYSDDREKYNKFIKEHGLLDKVQVSYELIGDSARYYI